ncbi:DUF6273 domain-containing protein [Lachnospiraceae bacterium 48-42]
MKKRVVNKMLALLMSVMMCAGVCPGFPVNAQEVTGRAAHSLKNPDGDVDPNAVGGYRTTWDCIWFGSYPQAEIVESAEDYAEVDKSGLKSGDIIEDAQLYQELSTRDNSDWDENNDIVVGNDTYHRISWSDAQKQDPNVDETYYQWTTQYDKYHFFKYEPVKWRVLKVDGNQVKLLSDIVLDAQQYNSEQTESVTWENSTVRSWLNGDFFNRAFSQEEQSAVIDTNVTNGEGENNTTDKIFLMSEKEASDSSEGFAPRAQERSETRWSKSSTYAKAMGVKFYTDKYENGVNVGGSSWWMRAPAGSSADVGLITTNGTEFVSVVGVGVRVGLNLELSSNHYTYAGKVCSDGTESAPDSGDGGDDGGGNGGISLNNPKIVTDSSMKAGQKVTWDCVWFGSYPQAEVVPSADNYTSVDKSLIRSGDIIGDSSLYNKLKNAPESQWNAINDITIDGEKYRRLERSEAHGGVNSGYGYYNWSENEPYHYFKYEPIKWRVLRVDGNRAFLLAEQGLDNQYYNYPCDSVTWETSMMRSWLNGYGKTSNQAGRNYGGTSIDSRNFINSAFTKAERSAIEDTTVVNADNIQNKTEGGNDTTDKIFLLSESEVYGDSAKAYGFTSSARIKDEGRTSQGSIYAKALGICMEKSEGISTWWLRSPGDRPNRVAYVCREGDVIGSLIAGEPDHMDGSTMSGYKAVRPALNLIISSNCYTSAGTVSSGKMDNDTNSGKPGNSGTTDTNTKKPPVKVSKITLSGISKQIAAGKKIKLTAKITPSNAANKAVTWKSSNKKVATVNSAGVVTIKKKTGGKSVTITATAKDGSKVKATYKIKSMKGVVKKVTISGSKSVKAKKTLKLKAKVTATKKANKKLKWTTSNKKYATVSSSGKVKALKAGKGKKVKITAMATDGSGKKKSVTIKIK